MDRKVVTHNKKIESLKFEGITFAHENSDPLFSNVDFEFPMNEFVWVKAMSGAGRSTLLQILAGLQVPTHGKYLINGEDVCDMTFEEFLPYRMTIGYTFDYGGLLSNRTVFDNLMLPLAYHKIGGYKQQSEMVNYYIAEFNLEKYRDQRPAHIPGGVRKLVCLLRALVLQPQMLLLDDPSIGLGNDTIYKFVDHLHSLRKEGIAQHVFLSSFDEKFMSLLDYEIVHIDGGILHYEKVAPEKKVAHL
jgi:phospholipid/cholesterol/gamma-HCH transport system ATP-binding protein